MSKIETLEKEIESLTPDELREFREWFLEFDAKVWDQIINEDIKSGKLNKLAAEALNQHKHGKSQEL